uniref:laccase n=1 Tax=Nelumbo nucifera TaxID=4432 RepID=A0A822XY89_NELNU|nr:TPA_asm: hypothetical protein HUJ06_028062 [Nelumbo nucifera]
MPFSRLTAAGEWWNANVVDVENEALATGAAPNNSDAYTINGRPGDLYPCSRNGTYKLTVVQGKTYLLRIINAALNNQLFFKIARHNFTVVAVDASYTEPYKADVVVISPGQTTDVLLTGRPTSGGLLHTCSRVCECASAAGVPFDNTTTTEIVHYKDSTSASPEMPVLPAFNDTPTAHKFYSNLTSLTRKAMPDVDERMFITVGLGLTACDRNTTCAGPSGLKLAASMNNQSFQLPSRLSAAGILFGGEWYLHRGFPRQPSGGVRLHNPNKQFQCVALLDGEEHTCEEIKI